MEKEQFIKDKIKKLKSEGYSNTQSYAIASSMFNKMQQGGEKKEYYQMAGQYMDTRQRLKMYSNPMDFSIHNPAQPQQNYYDNEANNPFSMNYNNVMPQVTTQKTQEFSDYKIGDANLDNTVDAKDQVDKYGNSLKQDRTNIHYNDRVNIMNDPFGGTSLEFALNTAGAGFGSGNYGQAAVGTGLSLLKGVRNFMGGYARGKETQRVGQEMMDRRFEDDRLFQWAQQGGKIRNADILAQKAITDQGQGNIEVEDGEYKKDAMTGQIMPIVGEKHQENGKYKGGVKIEAKEGDKFLADYGKAPKEVVSEFSDTFGVKAKKGSSYAELLKTLERGIGQTKLEKEKADKIIALEKAQKTEDKTTKELNVNSIQKAIAKTNEKINTLSGVRDEAFEFLFNKQESYPKKGNGNQLLDDNGNPIDTNEMVVQQGGMIGELAKKHNISLERAMELMQEGGEMMPQEQEQQIMQMVAQLLQQGASPEEVVQQLVSQGVPQEMAIQAVEMIMQQSQGQEQAPMQQGGKKDDIDNYILSPDFNRQELFTNQPYTRELGDKGWLSGNVSDENIAERIRLQRQRLPYLTDNFFPSEDVKQADIEKYQKSYNDYLNSAEKAIDKNKNLTDEQKNKLKERLKTERFDPKQTARDFDKKYGNFTSSRVGVALPLITKKDREKYPNLKFINDVVDKEGNIKEEYKDLSNEAKQNIKATQEDGVLNRNIGILDYGDSPQKPTLETPADLQQFPDQPTTEVRDRVKNILPNLPTYMPMISPLDPLAKQNFNMGRYYFNKGDVENNIAASYNAYDTAQERVQQSGISPWQIEAVSGQNMATHIAGVNEAIARQEVLDTQVMVNTEDKNVATAAKEQIMNNQANSVYQDQSLAGINNYRDSLNNAYKEQFLQSQSDRNYINNLNKANTLSNQFAITPNSIEYLNNREQNPLQLTPEQKQFLDGLPPQQRALWSKAFAQKYGTA